MFADEVKSSEGQELKEYLTKEVEGLKMDVFRILRKVYPNRSTKLTELETTAKAYDKLTEILWKIEDIENQTPHNDNNVNEYS